MVTFFYEVITPAHCQFIDMMYNGEFLHKEAKEVLDYFDCLAENAQSWDISDLANRLISSVAPQLSGG